MNFDKNPSFSFRTVAFVLSLWVALCPIDGEARLFKKKERKTKSATQAKRVFAAQAEPDYELPYSGWEFPRQESTSRFFDSGKPSPEKRQLISVIRKRSEKISTFGLPYKFGGDHPSEGGMDCSGTMKFLISDLGFDDMPRTSYQQYEWLKKNKTMHHTKTIPETAGGRKGIKPGDLIFWGGTYNSGHKVSHVMIYLGQSEDGTHYMFGARGKNKSGLFGSGVDIFELSSGYKKSLIGYGSLPGAS